MNNLLCNLTVENLINLLAELISTEQQQPQPQPPQQQETIDVSNKLVYGLNGLKTLLGCSKTTASRIKQSGIIDEAITQIGNIIIVDAEKALKLIKAYSNEKKSKKRKG
jgi:hypothetical protein